MGNSLREGKKLKRNSPRITADKEVKMLLIRVATAVCLFVLFVHVVQVKGKCELSPYKPVKTVSEIKTSLQKIVSYCERKIGMAEIKKRWLEKDLKKLEDLNQKSAEEKRTKDKKVKILNGQIAKLQSEIASLQRQILAKNKQIRHITQRIITAGRNIAAANNRVNSLTASIRSKQAHIDALNRRIAKERAKRRCFGRKRRSVEERAPRVRRGWRVRRVVRKVARETRRVVKQVVTLPKCVVDNIVSRLTRSKEKAEREKNSLNWQLSQAQRAKINAVGDRNRLTAQKNADSRTLNTLNTSFKSMNTKFISSNYQKRTSDRDVCELNSRITELKRVIKTTDNRLKFIREAKSKLLGILSQLKTIRSSKLEDLEEMEAAGEDVADLLEDINEINEAIRKSAQTLIEITCGTSFTAHVQKVNINKLLQIAPGKCR